jgi:hypothetical protein
MFGARDGSQTGHRRGAASADRTPNAPLRTSAAGRRRSPGCQLGAWPAMHTARLPPAWPAAMWRPKRRRPCPAMRPDPAQPPPPPAPERRSTAAARPAERTRSLGGQRQAARQTVTRRGGRCAGHRRDLRPAAPLASSLPRVAVAPAPAPPAGRQLPPFPFPRLCRLPRLLSLPRTSTQPCSQIPRYHGWPPNRRRDPPPNPPTPPGGRRCAPSPWRWATRWRPTATCPSSAASAAPSSRTWSARGTQCATPSGRACTPSSPPRTSTCR